MRARSPLGVLMLLSSVALAQSDKPPLAAIADSSRYFSHWAKLSATSQAIQYLPWMMTPALGTVRQGRIPDQKPGAPQLLEVLSHPLGSCDLYRWTPSTLVAACR